MSQNKVDKKKLSPTPELTSMPKPVPTPKPNQAPILDTTVTFEYLTCMLIV
jgi:hypothetical protein